MQIPASPLMRGGQGTSGAQDPASLPHNKLATEIATLSQHLPTITPDKVGRLDMLLSSN
jgi:hypothetical protein